MHLIKMDVIYKHGRNEACLPFGSSITVEEIYQFVANIENIPRNNFYLTFNGKYLQSDNNVTSPSTVRLHLRLPGGKGGFGSMLRAIGARIEKTTNHEACRDLSGRRMRDVNHEKAIGEWMKQKEGEDEERKQKRVKKLEKILNPKHNYEDKGYTSNLQSNAEKIDEALKCALQKRENEKSGSKRKIRNQGNGKQKKNRMWIGVSDDESDESENDCENIISVGDDEPCCSKGMMDNLNVFDNNLSDKEQDEYETALLKENCIDNGGQSLSDEKYTDACAKSTDLINTSDTDASTENIDSVTTGSPKFMLTSNTGSSGCSIVAINNDIQGNQLHDDACNTNIDDCNPTLTPKDKPIDLNDYDSPQHLESVGLDRLKTALMTIGLKCGGTLQERAQRLYLTKNTPLDKLDRSLFAKQKKGKNKSK